MKPIGAAEQLMFTTVRLETNNSCGTGYFFNYKIGDSIVPIIVTNKHVVNYCQNEKVKFILHLTEDGETSSGTFSVILTTNWFFHPTQDLCFTYIASIFPEVKKLSGKRIFYKALDESMIYSEEQLKSLSMIESVVMIGYPSSLYDEIHNFPVFRYGYTAAHPGYDFTKKNIGLVDMACFPGSSGSPILILNQGSYWDKKTGLQLGNSRLVFLGTLFSGPRITAAGKIEVVDIPTATQVLTNTKVMVNLGYYIKAHDMGCFRAKIEEDLEKQNNLLADS